MKWDGLYATAIVSIADLKFRNMQRNIVLGPVTRVARAEPNTHSSTGPGFGLRFSGPRQFRGYEWAQLAANSG